jgi:hypothetical protein
MTNELSIANVEDPPKEGRMRVVRTADLNFL